MQVGSNQSANQLPCVCVAVFLQKLGQAPAAGTAGSYLQGHYSYPVASAAQGGMVAPNGMMPVYPFYHYQYHGAQGLAVSAAHFFPPVSVTAVATTPAIISKPTVMAPRPKGSNISVQFCITCAQCHDIFCNAKLATATCREISSS
jgi:hypothetical protein